MRSSTRPLLVSCVLPWLVFGASCAAPPLPATPRAVSTGTAAAVTTAGRYPAAPNSGLVYDLFGTKVPDPYRPLEDLDAPATRAWIEAENSLTDRVLATSPSLPGFRAKLTQLLDIESNGAPQVKAGKWFWLYDDGKAPQPSLMTAASEGGPATVVLDPNALSPDGKESLAGYVVSEDGTRIAYGLAAGGGDWTTWHIRDLTTGKDFPEDLPSAKYYPPQLTKDGKGLYYGRFPTPAKGKELSEPDHDHKVYFHVVGTPASADRVVYERPASPTHQFIPHLTEDDRYLVLESGDGEVGDRNLEELIVIDRKRPDAKPVVIGEGFTAEHWFIGSEGSRFFVQTSDGAPNKRVVAVDLESPDRSHWKEIVPPGPHPIEATSFVGRQLVVAYVVDAHSSLVAHDTNGKKLRDIPLPGVGMVRGVVGQGRAARSAYLTFQSYTLPRTAYRMDLETGKLTPFRAPKRPFDPAAYETVQTFYPAKDGTKIPITVVTRNGAPRDGSTPLLLTGYGFGGVSSLPYYRASTIAWLEHGGAFAVANMRGGGEYGDAWRLAAYREKKQVTYDDFADAARWLAAEKYTSASKLGIFGFSGGGLLVGVAETQHPELFGAVAPFVGVHDMLRFHLFGEGAGWAGDFGSPTVENEAKALRAYSPLHNVRPGTRYPATYIVTGDHDVRVAPLHSYKFAAALQAAQAGPAPILLRVQTSSGHGGATTRNARVDNDAEELAFFAQALEARR